MNRKISKIIKIIRINNINLIKIWFSKRKIQNLKLKRKNSEYIEYPKVTAIIECFNKGNLVGKIIDNLIKANIEEIIAIDDGSSDNTLKILSKKLTKPNHFIIHANDLYEVRMYNKAMKMASGKFILLLQDDDLPPKDDFWIKIALQYFEEDNKLGILGGRNGIHLMVPDTKIDKELSKYSYNNLIGGIPGLFKYKNVMSTAEEIIHPMVVNKAPFWISKKLIEDVGYFDEFFAPIQCEDVDFCMRSWENGWKVGLYQSGFENIGISGVYLYNRSLLNQQAIRNWNEIYKRYSKLINDENFNKKLCF
jgi:GT2 family glycosyltransferase